MKADAREFLDALFARCSPDACLTLTAIHPTDDRPVPSRHIPLQSPTMLDDALKRLLATNRMGWGAYFGLATRRMGLTRWQRGDMNALVEIPALIADIDEPPSVVLPRINRFPLFPSCIVSSGYGVHLYWLLDVPTTNKQAVNAIHQGLAHHLKGDYLAAATAIRLPASLNTKHGTTAPCEVIQRDWSRRYTLTDFDQFRKEMYQPKPRQSNCISHQCSTPAMLNPRLIQQVADVLLSRGYKRRETWLNGPCPYAHSHKHADKRPSFGFNTATGYGYCFVCGSILLKDICSVLCIDPVSGGWLVWIWI